MKFQLKPATLNDQTTFRNLFQFYLYEFSHFMGWPVTSGGRFIEDDLEGCWTKDERSPYLFLQDDEWCGLAIVDQPEKSPYTDKANRIIMAEFFIMGAYRRQGIGRIAATQLFDRYQGVWEVFQLHNNLHAPKFWRPVIKEYTRGVYQEFPPPTHDGILQVFDNR